MIGDMAYFEQPHVRKLFERHPAVLAMLVNPSSRDRVWTHPVADKQDHVLRYFGVHRHVQRFVQFGLAHRHPKRLVCIFING